MAARIEDRVNVFVGELRRRRVFRAAMFYLVGSWTVVEIAATVFPLFEWPLWSIRAVLYGVLAFFPVAMVGAWTFDLGPDGLRRTEPLAAPARGTVGGQPRSNIARAFLYVLLGITISTVGFGGYLYATRYLRRAEATLNAQPGDDVPARAITLYSHGIMYAEMGRREKAIATFRQLVQEFPEMTEARAALQALTADAAGR